MKKKKPCLVSHADVCNCSDMFLSHADICLVPRSNGPENKLTYHTHVLISLHGEYTGIYLYVWLLSG